MLGLAGQTLPHSLHGKLYGHSACHLKMGEQPKRMPWLLPMGCHGYCPWDAMAIAHGMPWLLPMGCHGCCPCDAMAAAHGMPWLLPMGCHGCCPWDAMAVAHGMPWLLPMGCHGCCPWDAMAVAHGMPWLLPIAPQFSDPCKQRGADLLGGRQCTFSSSRGGYTQHHKTHSVHLCSPKLCAVMSAKFAPSIFS